LKVGRLKVGRLKVGRLKVGRLKVGRLKVGRLKVTGETADGRSVPLARREGCTFYHAHEGYRQERWKVTGCEDQV
jgi:hypothetical protein